MQILRSLRESGLLRLAIHMYKNGITPKDVITNTFKWQNVQALLGQGLALEEAMFKTDATKTGRFVGMSELLGAPFTGNGPNISAEEAYAKIAGEGESK